MTKIVINSCYGGFSLSDKAIERLKELGYDAEAIQKDILTTKDHGFYHGQKYWGLEDIERDNSLLVQVVQELKEEANGMCAGLRIVEIPDDIEWEIEEYDGSEWVAEKHRVWS